MPATIIHKFCENISHFSIFPLEIIVVSLSKGSFFVIKHRRQKISLEIFPNCKARGEWDNFCRIVVYNSNKGEAGDAFNGRNK